MDNNENMNFATELLHEVKAQAKRWFIISIVELGIITAIIAGLLWYFSLPTEEQILYQQDAEQSDVQDSELRQMIGGDPWEKQEQDKSR